MSGNILAQYEHKEGNEIRRMPVSVTHVDDIWIWLAVHAGGGENWVCAVPWSEIVKELLPKQIAQLNQPEETPEAD